jgi:thiol-disulfide isomerase/thioredoxin
MFEFLYSKKFLVILGVVCIFVGISFYVYNSYIAPKINPDYVPNKEFIQQGGPGDDDAYQKEATIYFFHAKWCPYSKKVIKDVWPELKSEYNGKNINHYKLNFLDYDGDANEKELQDFEKTYNKKIDGYPSIFLVKDDQVIEFEAKPNNDTLSEFIHTVL